MRAHSWIALLTLLALAGILISLSGDRQRGPEEDAGTELTLYCAAGIRGPIEQLIEDYEERYGVRVSAQYGGSGTMLSALQAARQGDLYLAADDSFILTAQEKGLAEEVFHLSEMRAVVGVRKGNPKGIQSAADLLKPDVVLGIGEPDTTAIGRATRRQLEEAQLWDAVLAHRKVAHPTVNQLATDVSLGALDAAVIWDASAAPFDTVDIVRLPELERAPRTVAMTVLSSSEAPTAALRFARFCASRDVGSPVFEAHGFQPMHGDLWSETPRLEIYLGAMLNAAVDERLRAFADREGVEIDFKYNGCGILVGEMRAKGDSAKPDAFFSCDISFLDMVSHLFEAGEVVSSNPLRIVTAKGNEHGIQTLSDLTRPGLRVGLAHPEKSALGALTQALLEREGIELGDNLKLESPTGDYLVNQLRPGSLDAVVVYASNAARAGDEVHRIPIDLPGALAVQPFAVGRQTDHPRLLERLFEVIDSEASRQEFESLGFGWER